MVVMRNQKLETPYHYLFNLAKMCAKETILFNLSAAKRQKPLLYRRKMGAFNPFRCVYMVLSCFTGTVGP